MLDFLFISDPTTMASSHMPYYFLYLAGYLRERGYKCKVLDYKSRAGYAKMRDYYYDAWLPGKLCWNHSRFVCLSSYTPHFDSTLKLGDLVKFEQPVTTLVVGNAHATVRPRDFLTMGGPFDYVVRGEGEGPLLALANGNRQNAPGTVWLSPCGQLIEADLANFISGGDIATPAYDMVDMEWYLRPQKDLIRHLYTRSVYVFTSRGCANDCAFCATNMIWKANRGKRVRRRELSAVLDEVQQLRERWGAEFIYVADDTFGRDIGWLGDWFCKYNGMGHHLPYAVQTRADCVTEDMVYGLKASGCVQLDMGVESGSQRLLDAVHKGITTEQVLQAAEWCRKHRLRLFAFLMINLPGETEEDLRATETLMEKLRPSGCTVSICTPYPGTRLNEEHTAVEGRDRYYERYITDRRSFRMASHDLDLRTLEARWNRCFKAEPMFERMWPRSKVYWKTVWKSQFKAQYIRAWAVDLPATFAKWWVRRLGLAPMLKRALGR